MVAVSVMDGVIASTFIAVALFFVTRDPKTWVKAEAYITLLEGCFQFLLPHVALSAVIATKLDDLHLVLLRFGACMMIMPSIVVLLCCKSKDARVFQALLTGRVVGSGVKTIFVIASHFLMPGTFTEAHFFFSAVGHVLWLLLNTVHLYKYEEKETGVSDQSGINKWLIADAVWSAVGWLPGVLAPSFALTFLGWKSDFVHEHLMRVAGAMNQGTFVLSVLAIGFANVDDKLAVVKSRLITSLIFLAALISFYTNTSLSLKIFFTLSLIALPSLFAAGALMTAQAGHKKFS